MFKRHRRLRSGSNIRSMVRETELSVNDFIYPIFVVRGEGVKKEIEGLEGNYHYSVDRLDEVIGEVKEVGVKGVLVFGIPDSKDDEATEAWDGNGIVQDAIKRIKDIDSDIYVVTDVCMCQYTEHGHCGILDGETIENDKTLEILARIALSHANAGADMVAPSDMMDGRVEAIRSSLDKHGYESVPILSYSAKYASSFYGPFRAAAGSAPQFGDRKSYQMDVGNSREAMDEIQADIEQGADLIMVKPALSYLDIISKARERFDVPIVAYNVSGEYAMIKSGGKLGVIDGEKLAVEVLTSIKRAGADIIISYFALEVGRKLKG